METYKLTDDLKVFGVQVKTFPAGIGEAFDTLVNTIPGGFNRSYYGIAYMTIDGKVIYNAAAEEKYGDEAETYNCDRYVIEKGEYLTVTLKDWRKKTDSIKDVFREMMQDNRIDHTKPCVEWYKNDDEMVCMIRLKNKKDKI